MQDIKIKEYKLVGSRVDYKDIRTDPSARGELTKEQFSEVISAMILEGWHPIGGISFNNSPLYTEAFQAMVKYEEEYEKSILDDNDGWETIYKKESKLKMVKYE